MNVTAELDRFAEQLLDRFVAATVGNAQGGTLSTGQLHAAAQTFKASPQFTLLIRQARDALSEALARELMREKNEDPFQRLLAHPMTEAFESGRLSRDILPNYFSFLHLVLGDTREALTATCTGILQELKKSAGASFTWDRFYDDGRAKQALWSVLVRIAETFRRFDARRDWFLSLMQNRPQAVSLGPNAFVPRPAADEPKPFGIDQFNVMFGCLFGPLRDLPPQDALSFRRNFGAPPEQLLAAFFTCLEESGAVL